MSDVNFFQSVDGITRGSSGLWMRELNQYKKNVFFTSKLEESNRKAVKVVESLPVKFCKTYLDKAVADPTQNCCHLSLSEMRWMGLVIYSQHCFFCEGVPMFTNAGHELCAEKTVC